MMIKDNKIKSLSIIYPQNNIYLNCKFYLNNFFLINIKLHRVKNDINGYDNYLCTEDDCKFCIENIKNESIIYPIHEYYLIPMIVFPNSILPKNIKKEDKPFFSILLLDDNNYLHLIHSLKNLGLYSYLFTEQIYKSIIYYDVITQSIVNLDDFELYSEDKKFFYFNFNSFFEKNDIILRISFENKRINVSTSNDVYLNIFSDVEFYLPEQVKDYVLNVFFKIKNDEFLNNKK